MILNFILVWVILNECKFTFDKHNRSLPELYNIFCEIQQTNKIIKPGKSKLCWYAVTTVTSSRINVLRKRKAQIPEIWMWLFDILLQVRNIIGKARFQFINKTNHWRSCLFDKAVGWWLLFHYLCNLHNFVKLFGLRKCY